MAGLQLVIESRIMPLGLGDARLCRLPRPDTAFRSRIPARKGIAAQTRSQQRLHRDGGMGMADIPQEWRAYASKQAELDRRSSVDPKAWGLEAGLDGLLDGSSAPDTVDRTIASTARRSRYAQALLARHMRINVNIDGVAHLEARSALATIEQRMSTAHVMLLREAIKGRRMMGADRTNLSRARAAARHLAA